MTTVRHSNAGEILAARFPFTLLEVRPPKTTRPGAAGTGIPSPRSASPLYTVPRTPLPGGGYVLCDDCLGPAVIEARLPQDPECHEVCEACARSPYYDGAWIRPLAPGPDPAGW